MKKVQCRSKMLSIHSFRKEQAYACEMAAMLPSAEAMTILTAMLEDVAATLAV